MSLRVQTSSQLTYPSSLYAPPAAPAKRAPPAAEQAKPTELKAGDADPGLGRALGVAVGGIVCGAVGLAVGCALFGPIGIFVGMGAALLGLLVGDVLSHS